MEISRRTDYGVRVILDLATRPNNERTSTQDIAQRQNIPGPFLAKIISQLALSGLVTTYRGAGGGVSLAGPASEISLDDITVSRRHAEIEHTPDGYVVSDSGSLNGTYVNQERIERMLLRHGDELQIGKFRLVYFERND